MSAQSKPAAASGPKKAKPAHPPVEPIIPLKPQRKLLAVLSVIFALWVAGLITLYFLTPAPVHAF